MTKGRVQTSEGELTIGRLAKRAGVGVDTVRFYEKEGLIDEPRRSEPSGYRLYEPDTVRRIQFVRRAQELGFALREVKELLPLRVRPCEESYFGLSYFGLL